MKPKISDRVTPMIIQHGNQMDTFLNALKIFYYCALAKIPPDTSLDIRYPHYRLCYEKLEQVYKETQNYMLGSNYYSELQKDDYIRICDRAMEGIRYSLVEHNDPYGSFKHALSMKSIAYEFR